MDRARLLEKIQKCLALSASPEPHEAAATLRQAQKLSAAYNVTDEELGLASYASEKVDCPLQAGKRLPETLCSLTALMQRAFGVKVTVHREVLISDPSWCVTYYGKADRVALAAYSHPVVWRAMNGSWIAHLKRNPHLKGQTGARGGFLAGWLWGVDKIVGDLGMSNEEKAELRTYLLQQVPSVANGTTVKTTELKYNRETLFAGLEAAKDFSLHRPIGN